MIDGDCPECGSSDYDRTGHGTVECGGCGFEYGYLSEEAR